MLHSSFIEKAMFSKARLFFFFFFFQSSIPVSIATTSAAAKLEGPAMTKIEHTHTRLPASCHDGAANCAVAAHQMDVFYFISSALLVERDGRTSSLSSTEQKSVRFPKDRNTTMCSTKQQPHCKQTRSANNYFQVQDKE
jgi:hypothetical protein